MPIYPALALVGIGLLTGCGRIGFDAVLLDDGGRPATNDADQDDAEQYDADLASTWGGVFPFQCTGATFPETATTVSVANSAQLQAALEQLQSDTTIALAPNTYVLTGNLSIEVPRVVLRGATGDSADVIIDTSGAIASLNIVSSFVVIADLTLLGGQNQGLNVTASANSGAISEVTLYNLQMNDMLRMVGVSGRDGVFPERGVIACSNFVMSDAFRTSSGGACSQVSALRFSGAGSWDVYSNYIKGFWCPPTNEGFGIHADHGTIDISIRHNRLHENGISIRLGLSLNAPANARLHDGSACSGPTSGYIDNVGGLICSNTMSNPATTGYSDSGMMIWNSCDTQIVHNTFYTVPQVVAAIETRWVNSAGIQLTNNLVNRPFVLRNSAPAPMEAGNILNAQSSWFVDPPNGDLHLLAGAAPAIDMAVPAGSICARDVDFALRPAPADVGADEFASP